MAKKIVIFDTEQRRNFWLEKFSSLHVNLEYFSDLEEFFEYILDGSADILVVGCNDNFLKICSRVVKIKKTDPGFPIVIFIHENNLEPAVTAAKAGLKYIHQMPQSDSEFVKIMKKYLSAPRSSLVKFDLTLIESQILKEILHGKTNKEIAKDMSRAIRTIEDHRSNIMQKLKVMNQVELFKRAIQLGILKNKSQERQ